MKTLRLEGLNWKVESDHTTATIFTKFKKNGVAETEHIEIEGTPEQIMKRLEGKKYKILTSWNVKNLSWESLLKDGTIKYRRTKTLQAYGINGEGKKYNEENASIQDNPENAIIDTPSVKMIRNVKEVTKFAWLKTCFLTLAVGSLLVAIGVAISKLIKRW